MKKIILTFCMVAVSAVAFAYNPPFGGEELYRLTSPEMLSGQSSSASGGPDNIIVPSSIVFNPSLPAFTQRTDVDLSCTMLLNTDPVFRDDDIGFGFQVGTIVPTRVGVFSGTINGVFADFAKMHVKNVLTVHAGASKEITERIGVGANIYTGFYMGSDSDFTIGLDLGGIYRMDNLGFIKSPRVGFALLNCGKPASSSKVVGIDEDAVGKEYPGIFTPRVSLAGDLFKANKLKGSFSADGTIPTFQNFILDLAFSMTYDNRAAVTFGWQMNMRELIEGGDKGCVLPCVGLSLKLGLKSKKLSEKNADWENNEITPSLAWQGLYDGIHAISVGTHFDLGMIDTQAPEITLWEVK